MTFHRNFIEKYAKASLHEASGVDTQESILRLHLLPFIALLRLDQVSDEVIATLL